MTITALVISLVFLLPIMLFRTSGKVNAIFWFDEVRKVAVKDLRILIDRGEIIAFQRSNGWVRIGVDRVRGDGGSYGGPERREIVQKSLNSMKLHYGLYILPQK